ncbi:disease resistance protein RGA2-like [Gossypium australe]|uniref:Disease resistance protein RGA2-like n=1 Tax=Gossypium australe TaxID=47621 RepID=A0A5B6WGW0_9ROSI|nr:disease resistance protein RGA2-like [Gossypium australe]
MAETFIGAVLEGIVSKVISVTAELTKLAWGFKEELTKLRDGLQMIEVFVQDENNSVKLWLQRLKDVAYEADDVLDEFSYEILRSKVEIQSQIERRVLNFCSPSNSVAFRFEMAHKIKDILISLDDLNKLANEFGLQISPIFGGSNVETISFVDDFNMLERKLMSQR